jgi:hypothetical protein
MAVAKNPQMLKYTSDRLKSDRELVKTAVIKCTTVFMYVSDDLKSDKEFALFAISCPGGCDDFMCNDDDKFYSPVICHVSVTLLYDIDFLLCCFIFFSKLYLLIHLFN